MGLDSVLRAMAPGAGPLDFLSLLVAATLVLVATILGTGLFLEVMNARHPELKVQKHRVNRRKWQELAYAPASVLTTSLCFTAGLFAQTQGWTLAPLELSWWSVPLMFVINLVLYDAWFYWVHRLLHWRPMMRFHLVHHASLVPTCWSNHHDSLLDSFVFQVYFTLIVFVLPIPWPVLVAYKIFDEIIGMVGHSGYEHFASPLARTPWPLSSTVFHDQHHSHFRYNYAQTFSSWDRWMGTLYPGYDAAVADFEPGAVKRRTASAD